MRRREFLIGVGASACPLRPAIAQSNRIPQVGVLMGSSKDDPEAQTEFTAFRDRLASLGWREDTNIRFEPVWGGRAEDLRAGAAKLVRSAPDLILVKATQGVSALLRETQSIPIVFVDVGDPVESGFVASLARPGGNITGFTAFEAAMVPKWFELLKEVAAHVRRVLVLTTATNPRSLVHLRVLEAAAPSFGFTMTRTDISRDPDFAEAFTLFTQAGDGGVVVLPGLFLNAHTAEIVSLASKHRLPAIYPFEFQARRGGLLSYGHDVAQQFRDAAGYVHRILHGERAADLPVQQPTKFALVINLKTANALNLTIPPTLLARADEVIE